MEAVVITLGATPERLTAFHAEWDRIGAPVPLTAHQGVDLRTTSGIRGCWLSHRDALRASTGPTLMLEDDAIFAPDFAIPNLDTVNDADIIYLGGEHRRRPRPHRPGLVRCRYTLRTHAYIAPDPQRLADALDTRGPGGHLDATLNALGLTAYAVDPFTVGQRAGSSTVSRGSYRSRDQYWNQPNLRP